MGLFDNLKKKPADTHEHRFTAIPERFDENGRIYLRESFYDNVELDDVTDYEFLENHDPITFKEDGRTIHAFFDDAIDVGIVDNQEVIDMITDAAKNGDLVISSIRTRNMTLRIGFYKELDKKSLTPLKMTVSFVTDSFSENEGDTVACSYDPDKDRYAIKGPSCCLLLNDSTTLKIEDCINKGYDIVGGKVIKKEAAGSSKYQVSIELRFK